MQQTTCEHIKHDVLWYHSNSSSVNRKDKLCVVVVDVDLSESFADHAAEKILYRGRTSFTHEGLTGLDCLNSESHQFLHPLPASSNVYGNNGPA